MCRTLLSLRKAAYLLGLSLIGGVTETASAQDFALASDKPQLQQSVPATSRKNNVRLLRDWLDRLARQHNVRFAINDQVIANKYVDGSAIRLSNLESALDALLTPQHLTYKKVADYYVIQPATEAPATPHPDSRTKASSDLGDAMLLSPVGSLQGADANSMAVRVMAPKDKTVRGTVRDGGNNEGLPGVSVVLKGTQRGTTTDANGNFQIDVPDANAVLTFSYIGFINQEVTVGGQTTITIDLKATDQSLNEVVVVGYGTQKKESLTGAISAVSAKDIGRVHATTVTGMLAGKIPGVQFRQPDGRPGASANIQIRNMGGNPLFIIDGVPKDKSQFDNLAPNDVDNITVLKDASASIYGSRAANGVIIVTTKRGATNQKSTINLDAYYGVQNWMRFPTVLDAYDWNVAKAEAEVNKNGTTSYTQSELDKYKAGTEYGYQNFDWYDYIVKNNSPQSNINLSASGGSDKINYYVSGTRLDQNSVLGREFLFNRTNFQANVDAKITDRIKIGVNVAARQETRKNPGVPGGDDYFAPKFAIFRNRPSERPFANDNPAYLNTISNPASNWGYLNYKAAGFFEETINSVTPQLTGEYQTPITGLTLKGLYSYMFRDLQRDIFEYTYDTYTYNPTTQVYNLTGGSSNPYRERAKNNINESISQIQLAYNRSFGKHTVSGLLLNERLLRRERDVFVHSVPKTNVLPLIQFADTDTYNDNDNTQARVGYVGRFNYNYADKYFLEVAARRDASWKFAPTKRWGTFPSISAGWRISEEAFFKNMMGNSQVLTDLKVRASYGQLGDDNVQPNGANLDPYAYIAGYGYNSGIGIMSGNTTVAARDRGVANDRLSWLTAKVTDVGMDFVLFGGKLTGTVDYFKRVRDGLPAVKSDIFVPSELGYSLPQENLERDAVSGGEASLAYNGRLANGLRFTVGGNVSYARRRFLSPYNPKYGNSLLQYRDSREDRYSDIFWGYQVIGQFQSLDEINAYGVNNDGQGNKTMLPGDLKYNDVNGDGIINDRDVRPIGFPINQTPILSGGLFFTVSYKGFDFAMDFSAGSMMGFNRTNEQRNAFQNTGNVPHYLFDDRWHRQDPLNPDSPWIPGKNIPIRYNETGHSNLNRNSDWWLVSVSYFRNRTNEIGYTLPQSLTSKAKIQKLRIFVNTYNLFSIDNARSYGLDPEVQDENGLQYPQNKLVNVGLNLGF